MKSTSYKSIVLRRILTICAGLAILTALAFGLPNFVSDGTEKFSGIEAEIAREEIEDGYTWISESLLPGFPGLKARVKEVYKVDPERKCGPTGKTPGLVYRVTVNKVTFFGIERPGYSGPYCYYNN